MARGSEELYRSMGFQPSYYQGGGDEIGMAERQQDRDTDERRRRRDANTRASERMNDRVAELGRDIPESYMRGAEFSTRQGAAAEESQQRRQALRLGEQRYEKGGLDISEKRMTNEELAGDKKMRDLERGYWGGEETPGQGPRQVAKAAAGYKDYMDEMGRQPRRRDTEEAQAGATLEGTHASTDFTRKQTQLYGAEHGYNRQKDRRAQMQEEIADAVDSGDPQMLADTTAKWSGPKSGFTGTDLRLAETKGRRLAASNKATREMVAEAKAQGSQQGGAAMTQIADIRANEHSLTEAVRGFQDYIAKKPLSAESDRALEQVVINLQAMKKTKEADQVKSLLTVDTEGGQTRGDVMRSVLTRLISEEKRNLLKAKSTATGLQSPSIQNQLDELDKAIGDLEMQANNRVDLFGGGGDAVSGANNAGFTTNRVNSPAPAPTTRNDFRSGAFQPTSGGRPPAPAPQSAPNQPAAAPSLRHRAIPQPGAASQIRK